MSTLVTPAAPGPEQQDAPLTEQERKLLARLLSDPTYFPVEFRTWIRTYLEGSDIRLPSSAIVGGNAPKVNLPAGVILPFAGPTIPSNTILCDGQVLIRADYDLLFQAIGTTWGAPSGSQFNVPDLRDRALYGAGSQVGFAATDGRAAGSRGGPAHKHHFTDTKSVSIGSVGDHSHTLGLNLVNAINAADSALAYALQSGGGSNPSGAGSSSAGGHGHSGSVTVDGDTTGGFAQDKPSFAGINYIIATGK